MDDAELVRQLREPTFERGLDEKWIDAQRNCAADRIEALIDARAAARDAAPTFTAADLEKLANAVWSEYHISLEEKWTFRKEHVLNAMLADLAQRVKE